MVTVRELARAQGFPDWFVFESFKGNVVTASLCFFSMIRGLLIVLGIVDAQTNR